MTYAPADLLAVRSYVQAKTGLSAAELGIAGDAAHATTGGYHEGRVDLQAAGRLGFDYSVVESPRDSHPSDGASAFDLANFAATSSDGRPLDRHAVTRAVLDALNAGDPRTRDIREIIYSLDDVTVRRWDRLGIRSTGDSSHTFHTHWSFHRDSEGRRDADDNFLGLLREIFEGPKPKPVHEEDDMPTFQLKPGFVIERDVNGHDVTGTLDWAGETKIPTPAYGVDELANVTGYVSLTCTGVPVDVEVYVGDGKAWNNLGVHRVVPADPGRLYLSFKAASGYGCSISLRRVKLPDTPDAAATADVQVLVQGVAR